MNFDGYVWWRRVDDTHLEHRQYSNEEEDEMSHHIVVHLVQVRHRTQTSQQTAKTHGGQEVINRYGKFEIQRVGEEQIHDQYANGSGENQRDESTHGIAEWSLQFVETPMTEEKHTTQQYQLWWSRKNNKKQTEVNRVRVICERKKEQQQDASMMVVYTTLHCTTLSMQTYNTYRHTLYMLVLTSRTLPCSPESRANRLPPKPHAMNNHKQLFCKNRKPFHDNERVRKKEFSSFHHTSHDCSAWPPDSCIHRIHIV